MRAVTDAMADPPWYFRNFSAKGEEKNPVAHYDCMDLAAIKALPVAQLAAPDGALIGWAAAPMLPEAIDTIRRGAFSSRVQWRGASNHLPARSAHSARATAGARRNSGFSPRSASRDRKCSTSGV
jgi:hypothetical protein